MPDIASNIIWFGKYFLPEMFTAPSPAFHFDLEEQLRDLSCEKLVVAAPRGTAKSSLIAETYVLWHIFAEDRYRFLFGLSETQQTTPKYVVIISKTQREAKARLATIKAVLGDKHGNYNATFRAKMGNWGEETAKSWTTDAVELKNGTIIRAIGTRQPTRGLKSARFQRPTLIVVDDPEDEENTRTAEAMLFNRKWLEASVVPSLNSRPEQRGRIIVIGTPLNTECMVVKLQQSDGWTAKWYKQDAEAKVSRWWQNDKFIAYQGVLWPEMFSAERLLQKKRDLAKDSLLSLYYREYECEVVGEEDQIFKPEYIRYWQGALRYDQVGNPYLEITHLSEKGGELEILPRVTRKPVFVFTGVDPASTTNSTSDHTAVINVAVDKDDNIYHLPYVYKRLPPSAVIEAVAENHRRYKPFRGVVETTSAFEFVADYLWKEHRIRYIPDKPTIKKKGEGSRLERLEPLARQGRIFFLTDMHELKEQHINYPRGRDDLMDAEEKAVRYRTQPSHDIIDDPQPTRRNRFYDPMLS